MIFTEHQGRAARFDELEILEYIAHVRVAIAEFAGHGFFGHGDEAAVGIGVQIRDGLGRRGDDLI